MKKRYYKTDLLEEDDYQYDRLEPIEIISKLKSQPLHSQKMKEFKKFHLNRAEVQLLKGMQLQRQQIKKKQMRKMISEFMNQNTINQERKIRGRNLKPSQKNKWIQELAKPKYIIKKSEKVSRSRSPPQLGNRKTPKTSMSLNHAQSPYRKQQKKLLKRPDIFVDFDENQQVQGLYEYHPLSRVRKRKNSQDIKEDYQKFEQSSKLKTYFILQKERKENQASSEEQEEQEQVFSIYIPKQSDLEHFIQEYRPQNAAIKIEAIRQSPYFDVNLKKQKNTLYIGELHEGKKNGKGVYLTKKNKLEGLFENDEIIEGVERKQAGIYKGHFKDGKKHGEGHFIWNMGEQYSGEWKKGKKHGNGYWRSKQGDTYLGDWRQGKATGFGIYRKVSGSIYQGQFIDFIKHGKGKQELPNGDIFEGQYDNGYPNGRGKYTWKNGTAFEGIFEDGNYTGNGFLKHPTKFQYQGGFNKNGPDGISRLKLLQGGSIYHGMVKNGRIQGYGMLENKKRGQKFEGYWIGNEIKGKI